MVPLNIDFVSINFVFDCISVVYSSKYSFNEVLFHRKDSVSPCQANQERYREVDIATKAYK